MNNSGPGWRSDRRIPRFSATDRFQALFMPYVFGLYQNETDALSRRPAHALETLRGLQQVGGGQVNTFRQAEHERTSGVQQSGRRHHVPDEPREQPTRAPDEPQERLSVWERHVPIGENLLYRVKDPPAEQVAKVSRSRTKPIFGAVQEFQTLHDWNQNPALTVSRCGDSAARRRVREQVETTIEQEGKAAASAAISEHEGTGSAEYSGQERVPEVCLLHRGRCRRDLGRGSSCRTGTRMADSGSMASMLVCFVALAILRHMGMPSKNGLPISVVASVSGIMGISFIIVSEILKAGGS
ncbi:hypothetical protein ACFQX6_15340 [Streptosporangium lutulentum]